MTISPQRYFTRTLYTGYVADASYYVVMYEDIRYVYLGSLQSR
jgi:hypothetical protein